MITETSCYTTAKLTHDTFLAIGENVLSLLIVLVNGANELVLFYSTRWLIANEAISKTLNSTLVTALYITLYWARFQIFVKFGDVKYLR